MNYINEKSELLNIEATLIDERKINEILKYENVMNHPTWLVRKRVYDDLGGYRNFKLVEDYDFLLRCLRHNYRIGYMNEKVLSYRYMSKNYESNSLARQYLSGVYLSENMDRIDSITRAQLDDYLDKITAKYSNKAFWNAVDSSNKVASSIYYRNYVDAFKAFFEYRGYECPVLTYIMTRRKYRSIKIK